MQHNDDEDQHDAALAQPDRERPEKAKPWELSAEHLMALEKESRRRARREWVKKFMLRSRLGWLLHPAPHDEFFEDRLMPTGLAARRARFVRSLSWFALLQSRNARAYQLGLGGLIMAPIVSWVLLRIGGRAPESFPIQLGILYLSGLSYVVATALCNWWCPVLIKEVTDGASAGDPFRPNRLKAFVDAAINSMYVERVYPLETAVRVRDKSRRAEIATLIYARGDVPCLHGLGGWGQYQLEKAIFSCAREAGVHVFEVADFRTSKLSHRTSEKRLMFEGAEPYVVRLYARRTTGDERQRKFESDMCVPLAQTVERTPQEDDLVIDWCDADVQFKSERDGDEFTPQDGVHGMHVIYELLGVERLAFAAARWQAHDHLLARLVVRALYLLAVAAFVAFLAIQSWAVWKASSISLLHL